MVLVVFLMAVEELASRADALLLAAMATARLAIFFKALKRVH
jgi:hypothetical protein